MKTFSLCWICYYYTGTCADAYRVRKWDDVVGVFWYITRLHISYQKLVVLKKMRLDKLRTSPNGLKDLTLVPKPVGLGIASDELSASTTCNIKDVDSRRLEAYITRGGNKFHILNIESN